MDNLLKNYKKTAIIVIENLNIDFIPLGIQEFISKWEELKDHIPEFYSIKDKKKLIDFIENNNKDDYNIIFCFYKNPNPDLINYIIKKIKSNNKNVHIFASGPSVELLQNKMYEIFNIDHILLDSDIDNILNISSKELTNDSKWECGRLKNNIYIIPQSFGRCSGKCSFCIIGKQSYRSKTKMFSVENIINKIDDISAYKNMSKKITLGYCNIFDAFSQEEIKQLLLKIYKRYSYKTITIWTRSIDFVKNIDFIKDLPIEDTKIIWEIGFESFSKSQLKRYNKEYNYKYNYKCLELFNDLSSKRFGLELLLINLDPWLKREELYETYNAIINVDYNFLSCGQSAAIWTSGLNRVWFPYPETEMYNMALKENLLIKEKIGSLGYTQGLQYPDLPWKFKYKDSEKLIEDLTDIKLAINWTRKTLRKNDINSCYTCPGGFINNNPGYKYFVKLNALLLEFIKNGSQETKSEIMNNIQVIFDKICNEYNK